MFEHRNIWFYAMNNFFRSKIIEIFHQCFLTRRPSRLSTVSLRYHEFVFYTIFKWRKNQVTSKTKMFWIIIIENVKLACRIVRWRLTTFIAAKTRNICRVPHISNLIITIGISETIGYTGNIFKNRPKNSNWSSIDDWVLKLQLIEFWKCN